MAIELNDLLNIQPNKVNTNLASKTMLIYGGYKAGKTSFCAKSLPNALLCAFEKGYNAIPDIKVYDINKWTEFKRIVKLLEAPEIKNMYKTIIIDTIDLAAGLCEDYICQQHGVGALKDIPYGQGFGEYERELASTFRKITMLGYGLAFTAQKDVKTAKDNKGDDIEILQPLADKRTLKVVNALVDFILYIEQEWDENGVEHRYFRTRNTPFITAGSRFGGMADKIPFNYDALIAEIDKAIKLDTKGDLTLITNEEVDYSFERKRPFSETMQEAGEIWGKFPKTQEWNERKMKVVEEYFGQPIKLSTATEAQQDLVESVIDDLKNLLLTVN